MKRKSSKADPAKKRILIVDDHPMMRDGLRLLIANESDMEVVAEADDAFEALNHAEKLKPDIAIVDITLRSSSGLDLIKDLQIRSPATSVLVLSMHDESLYAERVLRAGGRGYIMKQEGGKRIVEGLRQIAAGHTYVSPAVSARILDAFSGHHHRNESSAIEKLTDREFEVFSLLVSGKSITEIANGLHLSVKTVSTHKTRIMQKMGMASLSEMVQYAVAHKLLTPFKA